jgi:hypothetical protein
VEVEVMVAWVTEPAEFVEELTKVVVPVVRAPVALVIDEETSEAWLAAEEVIEPTADERSDPEREAEALAIADDTPDVISPITLEAPPVISEAMELGAPPTADVTSPTIEVSSLIWACEVISKKL